MAKSGAIKTKIGEKFCIELSLNTTGFVWKPQEPYAPFELLGEEAKPSEAFGGEGTAVFSFRCMEQGTFPLSFCYKRPWESSPTDQLKTYSVTVE